MIRWMLAALVLALGLTACGEAAPPAREPGAGSPETGDFALSLRPEALTLERGGSAVVTVTVERTGGFGNALSVDVAGAPPGVTAEPLTIPATSGAGELILRAAADAPLVSSAQVAVRGSSEGRTRDGPLSLSVVGGPATGPTLGPTITSFTASPATITPGSSVTLSWQVEGASRLALEPIRGDASGRTRYTVWPRETTLYTLRAEGPAGERATRRVSVTVQEVTEPYRILAFSRTARGFFRHAETIPAGLEALRRLGEAHGFSVDHSENAADFTPANLARYAAVVFLLTSGPVLVGEQQSAFEGYIAAGGGFVGVHSASVVGYGATRPTYWPWYEGLVGAYFAGEAGFQDAVLVVEDREHPSTAHLGERWEHHDEVYSFHGNPRARVNVLLSFDVSSIEGGTMGGDHPVAWYHDYGGGRAWYTALGHFPESWQSDERFLAHILGGIRYAAAR